MSIKAKVRTWWEINGGEKFVIKLNTTFEAVLNFSIACLLIASLMATVVSAFHGDGINTLIYALSSLIIAFITRLI